MGTTNYLQEALIYHSQGRPGKIEVIPSKPYHTQRDLSLAYTPGVAVPCLEIEKNPEDAYKYTAKGNLVAVVSNGTAVLGLGDIGAMAGKPVMEGKGLLFKVFGDVDVFDIEVNTKDVELLIQTVKLISPTFGGINLEDIKAPECFEIEERLKAELDIPVFHDDQHGTAIISSAALLNALEISGKKIEKIKVVVNGAGAAAISCTNLYIKLGVKPENVIMVDSKGVLTKKRKDLNKYKQKFAIDSDMQTLAQAIKGADLFLGLSQAGALSTDMLKSMAAKPIVFAMANPNPEIAYNDAMSTRDDLIFATGRSDYPNQVNNVLGFPYIFRGALDVRATGINDEMKLAAAYALADLAKQAVPESVNKAYNMNNICFGKEYLIPKPLDPRLISTVALAVAQAAVKTGVAKNIITDWNAYKEELNARLGYENKLVRGITNIAKKDPRKIVFAEANNFKILKAAQIVSDENIAIPILLGDKEEISKIIRDNNLELDNSIIIDPRNPEENERRKKYTEIFFNKRQRKGITYDEASEKMSIRDYFGLMMVETGEADGYISGFSSNYADNIRPAVQVIGTKDDHLAGMYIVMSKKGSYFFADTTVNYDPSVETMVSTVLLTAEKIRSYNIEPRIAMLSYSNFGSQRKSSPKKVQEAVKILHRDYPDLIVDGEFQANFALNKELRMKKFPFSKLGDKEVNTLIFPSLNAGNIAYKMMQEIGGADVIGPILMGIKKPIHILQLESSVKEIVDMVSIAVIDAQNVNKN